MLLFFYIVKDDNREKIMFILQKYKEAQESNRILNIPFTTLSEYLHFLKGAAQGLQHCDKNAMFYLAAAVSDFYIPSDEMVSTLIYSNIIKLFQGFILPFILSRMKVLLIFLCSQNTKFSHRMVLSR